MNNKEFITELASRMQFSTKDTTALMTGFIAEFSSQLEEENAVAIQGFGTFEVKKKMERVLVNPGTKQKMLVPPKMVLNFRLSPALKDRLNAAEQ